MSGQNGCLLADVFRPISLKENNLISISNSRIFLSKDHIPIVTKPALVQVMVWHQKDLQAITWTNARKFADVYMQHQTQMR